MIPTWKWIVAFKNLYALDNQPDKSLVARHWPALNKLGMDVFQDIERSLKDVHAPDLPDVTSQRSIAWLRMCRSYKPLAVWYAEERDKIVAMTDRAVLTTWLEDKVVGAVKVTVTAKHVEEAKNYGDDLMIWLMEYLLPPMPVAESKPVASTLQAHCDACQTRMSHTLMRNKCCCFYCAHGGMHQMYDIPSTF